MRTVRFFMPLDKGMQIAGDLLAGSVHAPMADELRSSSGRSCRVEFTLARHGLQRMEVKQVAGDVCRFVITTPSSVAQLEALHAVARGGREDVEAKVLRLLETARSRISDESSWCAGRLAENDEGRIVPACWEAACRWCALGALIADLSVPPGVMGLAEDALNRAAIKILPEEDVPAEMLAGVRKPAGLAEKVNDDYGHAEALLMYDMAIAELSGRLEVCDG